jgi:integrase
MSERNAMASIDVEYTKGGEKRYVVHYRDPNGDSREEWFRRKVDAERRESQVEVELNQGTYIDPREGKVPFGEYVTSWFDSRVHLRPTTRSTQASLLRNHIDPVLGRRPIAAIRHSHVRNLVAQMQANGLSASTIRATHALVYGALEAAANDRLIPRNPASGVDLPQLDKKPMRILDHEEIAALADAVDPRYAPAILLAAYCGLRFGEIAGLRVDSINVLGRTLDVSASLNEVSGKLILGPPKTATSRRRLALPRFVANHLAAYIDEYPPEAEGLLVTGANGGGLRRSNFRKRVWLPAVAATVGPPCAFHDLRHSHAALLIREGLHPKVIQERMGHASIRTTLDTYGHLFPGLDEAAADALDAAACGVGVGLGRFERLG